MSEEIRHLSMSMNSKETVGEHVLRVVRNYEEVMKVPVIGTMGWGNIRGLVYDLAFSNMAKDLVLCAYINNKEAREKLVKAAIEVLHDNDAKLRGEKNESQNNST